MRWLSIVAIAGLLAGCTGSGNTGIAKSEQARITAPDPAAQEVTALVEGNNAFALSLYQQIRTQEGNLVFSPFSLSLALAMTYAGARGGTESQMADTLHFGLPQEQLHPAFNALDLQLEREQASGDEQPLQLRIANAVWAEQTRAFLPAFLDTLALNYGAGVRLADFINQPEPSRVAINNWVSDQTEDRINDLIPPGVIDPLTRMVLVNAIYFKADWLLPFDPDSTRDMSFRLTDGTQARVPTMNQDIFARYAEGDAWQALELPYVGETAAMVIILPAPDAFEEVEAGLGAADISAILGALEPASVQLSFPKFEYESEFGMAEPLRTLGMTDAFDDASADFSGMDGTRELVITDVVHKAFVAVDEKGTEAAAASGVIMGVTSAPLSEITFLADRPFLFLIRDLQTGQILFMGRVVDPR